MKTQADLIFKAPSSQRGWLMDRRTSRAASLLIGGVCAMALASVFAKSAKENISDCNSTLGTCCNICQKNTYPVRTVCEDGCLKSWNACMDKAGAPKTGRQNPLKRKAIDTGKATTSETKTEATPKPPKISISEKGLSGKALTRGASSSPLPDASSPSRRSTVHFTKPPGKR
jgi:hypothetical protein